MRVGFRRQFGSLACAWAAWLGVSASLPAQTLDGPATGVSYADVDRQTGRRRSLLRFASVEPAGENILQVKRAVLEFYGEAGETNVTVTTDECRYDTKSRRAWSPGDLKVMTGAGQVEIQGRGFACVAGVTNSLVISNDVRAVVDRSAMGGTNALRGSIDLKAPAGSGELQAPLVIRSRQFEVLNETARFVGDVRVEDPLGVMRCRVLTLQAKTETKRLERLLASGDVILVAGDREATASDAVYELASEQLELTGGPAWRSPGRKGRADRCWLDRTRNAGRAEGDVEMEFAANAIALGSVMATPRPPGASTNQGPVKVAAGRADFGATPGLTNQSQIIFQERVRLTEGEGSLNCDRLTVLAREPGNQPVGATAEGHVMLRQGAAEVVANQAAFDAAADTVVFTGDPRWRLDDRSGSADRLSIALQSRIERAEGRVMMQAPAGLLGGRTWLMPGGGVTKPETAKTGASSTNVVQIRSDDFEYAPAATEGAPDIAMFRGHVEVRDGGGARLTCDRIRVQLDSKQRAARELEASGGVEMRFEDEGGDRLARGDRLRYDAARDEVELSGASGVTFVFRDKRGESRGFGQRAVYRVKPDTLTLLGNPMVEAPEGRFTGDQVRLDRRTGDVNAAGYWRARLPLPGTNQFTLPEGFKPKSKR